MTVVDWIGFAGVTLLLVAYFLNLKDVLNKNNAMYILLNLTGASIACIASILLKYMPFVILEGCWVLVSIVELSRYINKRNEQKKDF